MKIFIFCVFTLFAFVATANTNLIKKPGELNMTAKFQKKLKEFTDKIADPFVLSEKNLQLNTENIELDATLSGSISGIKGLAVNDFKISIFGGISISSFEFELPKLVVNITSYDLDGILGLTHIYGRGMIFLNLDNVVLKGNAKIGVETINEKKYAKITLINADLSLDKEKFEFKITGWLDDEMRSKFMTKLINNLVHNITPEVKDIIDEQISGILTNLVADFLIPLEVLTKP